MDWRRIPTTNSPWGEVDQADQIADDIWSVATPGHGGFYIGPESYSAVPAKVRRSLRGRRWFEEDVEMYIVLQFVWDRCNEWALGQIFPADRERLLEVAWKLAAKYHSDCLPALAALRDSP